MLMGVLDMGLKTEVEGYKKNFDVCAGQAKELSASLNKGIVAVKQHLNTKRQKLSRGAARAKTQKDTEQLAAAKAAAKEIAKRLRAPAQADYQELPTTKFD